jgi:predicted MFS family arabinose efflux permease
MSYFSELRAQWRAIAAATIGIGTGSTITLYAMGVLAPLMLQEFGWTRSQFALIGASAVVVAVMLPIVGRFVDVFGVRAAATGSIVAQPIFYSFYIFMSGDIRQYFIIFILQMMLSAATTGIVYSRTIVQRFDKARGLALAIAASGSALTVAIGGPLLNNFVAEYGWRAGFQAMAIFTLVGGAATLLLLPPDKTSKAEQIPKRESDGYWRIFRNFTFWLMYVGLLFVNLPQLIGTSQLVLVLEGKDLSVAGVSTLISTFAIGTIVGRIGCGIALDRFPTHIVAAISLGLPSVGLFVLGSSLTGMPFLFGAVLIMGLSAGAEADVVAYLVMKKFGLAVFSSVFGLLMTAFAAANTLGAVLLSYVLSATGAFDLFLIGAGLVVLLGSSIFLMLGRDPTTEPKR